MYTDINIIQNAFKKSIAPLWDDGTIKAVYRLIDRLKGKDTYIDENLWMKLQNLLPLDPPQASHLIHIALELSTASAVAALLLLEKVPSLVFYDLVDEIGAFLLTIKNHGSRALALFLGSEQTNTLRVEDLVDVLEQSTPCFYRPLLQAVQDKHQELGVCCALIMRFAAKIERMLTVRDIDFYLELCSSLIKNYGSKITEQYIRHAHEFVLYCPLNKQSAALQALSEKSLIQVEFAVTYPHLFFAIEKHIAMVDVAQYTESDLRQIKLTLLTSENYGALLATQGLLDDKNFLALVMNWPVLNQTTRANILFQMTNHDYKHFIETTPSTAMSCARVNQITHDRWFESWLFCGEVVDISFIRKRIGCLLQHKENFSLEPKLIIKNHPLTFDRSNPDYPASRLCQMLTLLLQYCVEPISTTELQALLQFGSGQPFDLRNLLSQTELAIQVWNRDPWTDYGRSDELFSCTSLGDYNASNAPAFLADLNLNNLDLYSQGARVGRVRLCLAYDTTRTPILLLDCLDGTERVLASQKRFELIMRAVLAFARRLEIKTIKLNYDVDFNTTPKKFIAFLTKRYKQEDNIAFFSRFLTETTTRQVIPYPCQTFLESFVKNQGAFIRGATLSTMDQNEE